MSFLPGAVARAAEICVLSLFVLLHPSATQCQTVAAGSTTAVAPPASASPYRMIQASAGTKQVQRNGRVYFEDPRNEFRLGEDHKVVVEFQWAGPAGPHKLQGMWKDPSGQVVVVSSFDFAPNGSPFSAFFTLLVDDMAAAGIWTIDATIDGQTAGSYSFQIVSAGATLSSRQPAPRIPMTAADIYRQTESATVFIDKLDASGKLIGHGSGFFADSIGLVTTFENIDGANNLKITLPNGQLAATNQVVAWNRWQDWVIVKLDSGNFPALKSPAQRSWAVGDACFSLGTTAGGRAMVNGGIVGDTNQPRVGPRISLSFTPDSASIGAPVLNEFGEVIGMLAHGPLPGVGDVDLSAPGGIPPAGARVLDTGLAVPVELVKSPPAGQAVTPLTDLAAKGLFVPPLQASDQVGFAALALGMDSKGGAGPAWPRDRRTQFSLADRQMTVFVNWLPKAKFKGVTTVRFFDLDNRELAQSKPLKINLEPTKFLSDTWTIPLATFSPGIYRTDVYLGDAPAWREYFRIIP